MAPIGTPVDEPGWTDLTVLDEVGFSATTTPLTEDEVQRWRAVVAPVSRSFELVLDSAGGAEQAFRKIREALGFSAREWRRTETPARSRMHTEYRRKTRGRNRNRGRR